MTRKDIQITETKPGIFMATLKSMSFDISGDFSQGIMLAGIYANEQGVEVSIRENQLDVFVEIDATNMLDVLPTDGMNFLDSEEKMALRRVIVKSIASDTDMIRTIYQKVQIKALEKLQVVMENYGKGLAVPNPVNKNFVPSSFSYRKKMSLVVDQWFDAGEDQNAGEGNLAIFICFEDTDGETHDCLWNAHYDVMLCNMSNSEITEYVLEAQKIAEKEGMNFVVADDLLFRNEDGLWQWTGSGEDEA